MIVPSTAERKKALDRSDSAISLLKNLPRWRSLDGRGSLSRLHALSEEKLLKLPKWSQKRAPHRSLRLNQLAERAAALPLAHQQINDFDRSFSSQIDQYKGRENLIVLCNGAFVPQLSRLKGLPKGTEVLDLATAFRAFPAHLMRRSVGDEDDFFALFNAAVVTQGAAIFLPPNSRLSKPLHIAHIGSSKNDAACFSRLHIIAGANSALHLVLSGQTHRGWQSDLLDLCLEEGARIDLDEKIETDPTSFGFFSIRASLKKSAQLHASGFTTGSFCTWRDIRAKLMGELSRADLSFTSALSERNRSAVSVKAEHLSEKARSFQWIRSALADRARFSFCGKIFVAKGASQTESYQLNNNLVLSDNAIADSQPNLEILNDDVKASHGATAGQIRDEDLFYLQSRGIPIARARSLLIQGFIDEGIARLKSSLLRDEARCAVGELF